MSEIKRTTWSVLPWSLQEAGQLAFPNCKSPRSVPDDKWEKLVLSFKVWHHIFYSDKLAYSILNFSAERQQKYLNEMAMKIAQDLD